MRAVELRVERGEAVAVRRYPRGTRVLETWRLVVVGRHEAQEAGILLMLLRPVQAARRRLVVVARRGQAGGEALSSRGSVLRASRCSESGEGGVQPRAVQRLPEGVLVAVQPLPHRERLECGVEEGR